MICTCRDPLSLGVVHRSDAPCYIPEQRQSQAERASWVGLTDEEVEHLVDEEDWYNDPDGFTRAIEAKLKEKNCG